jgi:NAD(P)-dependent dehydrogenase (short-subunit alcohol dehydrogenase family)
MRLQGRVAIVTGSGTGIGEAIATRFAREGAAVCITGRTESTLRRVADDIGRDGGKALAVVADIGLPADVARLVEETERALGPVDILVNNAGIAGPTASILEIPVEQWEEVLRTNLTGVFLCCKAVAPGMIERRRGWIVNIGSITGKRPLALRTPYATSKLGLVGFTRTLAVELGPYGITVNNISPGAVNTQRLRDLAEARKALDGRTMGGLPLEAIAVKTAADLKAAPLERLSEPEDIAGLSVFLCTEDARNITGQDINVSAGMVMY